MSPPAGTPPVDTATLRRCLADLEARLDETEEEANLAEWRAFVEGSGPEGAFTPSPRTPSPPRTHWPEIHINDAVEHLDAMVLRELKIFASDVLARGGGERPAVRCNYGTGILPSLFGAEPFRMPRETHTLPTVRPLVSTEALAELIRRGVPSITSGLGGRVFACAERFGEWFEDYPKVGRHVALYHPDVQGPIDTVELLWGSEMFLGFYDEPALLDDLLELVTETYTEFMRAWYRLVPPDGELSTHWGFLHRGRLMIRNDSLMNLSPEMYVEHVRPLDQRLFDEFGGGAIHYCGRGDHFVEAMSEMRGLHAIDMSQPHLNDLETIFRHTIDKDIVLVRLSGEAVDAARNSGRDLTGLAHWASA